MPKQNILRQYNVVNKNNKYVLVYIYIYIYIYVCVCVCVYVCIYKPTIWK